MNTTEDIKDLKINWWRTSFSGNEVAYLEQAVKDERISEGVKTQELQVQLAERLKVKHVFMTPSGSLALVLAMMALDIGPGDEVIVPNRTWIATAHAVLMTGAKVVLIDVEADRPVMDTQQLAAKITDRTKAILPVHLNGRIVNMSEVHAVAKKYDLKVVEDACQGMFVKDQNGYLGTQSDIGCFSLSVTKLISTGQGGFVVTNDDDLAAKIKSRRNHGVYDIFTDSWNEMGLNLKFTDLLACFGLAQLERVEERIVYLRKIYAMYAKCIASIPGLELANVDYQGDEVPLYVEILADDRDHVLNHLKAHGIQTRPVPPNIDISQYIANDKNFPHSQRFARHGLYLPSGPCQKIETIEQVIDVLKILAA